MSDLKQERTLIPEELRKQLGEFQKSLWRIKVTEAVLAGVFGLLASFLLVFFLERFFAMPGMVRLLILLAGTSLAAGFAPYWIRRWVYGHRREEQLARLIARKFPKFGDRLLGIVELQDQDEVREMMSPELRQAAMVHVANLAAKRDMKEALPVSRHKKLAMAVGVGGLAVVAGFALAPRAGENAFQRWLFPLADTERYTFTQIDLERIPNPKVVAINEAFSFEVPLRAESEQRPAKARARFGQKDWVEADLQEDGVYRFSFTGEDVQDRITVEAGDAKHLFRVEPEIRPQVEGFTAEVTLPAYLELEPREFDLRTGTLSVLEGSEMTLSGVFTRELVEVKSRLLPIALEDTVIRTEVPMIEVDSPRDLEGESAELPIEAEFLLPDPQNLKLVIAGKKVTTEKFSLGHYEADISFQWKDVKGLEGASATTVKLKPLQDNAPAAYLQGVERQVVILPEQTVEFEISAEDDFGLKEIGIAWQGELAESTIGEPAEGSLVIQKGGPSASRLGDSVAFSPKAYGIEPQAIALSVYTEDYKPGRGRVYSEPIYIYVLTRDQHAEVVKKQFDRLLSELEDAARRELNNLDANERLDQQTTPEELQEAEAQKKLAESEAREAESREKMKDLAEKMEDIFKEAARNDTLDKETMKQLAEALDNMKELAEQDLPEVEKKLGEAQDNTSTPEKTESDLKEAIEKQKEAVKKMQETIEKSNQASENFEASTFVNRLKRAATEQDRIAGSLIEAFRAGNQKEVLPLLGATPGTDSIDPIHQRLLSQLDGNQKKNSIDVRWIQEDLGRFFARTQKAIHGEIYNEMAGSLVDEKLEQLRELIGKNQAFTSTRLSKKWSNLLNEWAKKLEGAGEGGGGGGGGGGGSGEDEDFEFMLKVLKMVQAEQDIRGRTRSLEQMLRSLNLSPDQPFSLETNE